MKGPSLFYDLQVLRVFRCEACGREVHAPGHVTSQICQCSDPPKFMRPLERPPVVSPDVSAFISTPDPDELVEAEEPDDVPSVPHVPVKPPLPPRFANRRKLYDEASEVGEDASSEFGDGIADDQSGESDFTTDPSTPNVFEPDVPKNTQRNKATEMPRSTTENRDRESSSRRRRGRSRNSGLPQTSQPDTSSPLPRPDGNVADSRNATRHTRRRAPRKSETSGTSGKPDAGFSAGGESAASENSDEPKRRGRRGRRRRPRPEGDNA